MHQESPLHYSTLKLQGKCEACVIPPEEMQRGLPGYYRFIRVLRLDTHTYSFEVLYESPPMPVFDIQPNGIHIRDAYVVVAHSFVRDEVGFLVLNWHDNLFYRVKGPVSTSGFVLSALRYEDVRVLTLGPRIDFAFKASFCFDY